MARRRNNDIECTCAGRPAPVERSNTYGKGESAHTYTWTEHPNCCRAECCLNVLDVAAHHYGCALWGSQADTYTVGVTKPTKSLLGSKRTPFEKWSERLSLYSWPLWRNWKPSKPIKVEHKPSVASLGPYPWKLWHQHRDLSGTSLEQRKAAA